jgi:hypothetical protein
MYALEKSVSGPQLIVSTDYDANLNEAILWRRPGHAG